MIDKQEVARCTEFVNRNLFARYAANPTEARGQRQSDLPIHNCYTLAKYTQETLFNRSLPIIELESDAISEFTYKLSLAKIQAGDSWVQVEKPVHGCIVEMSHATIPHHIGTFLDLNGGGIFHCVKDVGACFDSIAYLKVGGWRRFIYDVPR